jgi:tetratricopeptide (TPR) repeat protein
MSLKRWILPLSFPVIAFLASACGTVGFSYKTLDINGMVYDFSNRPVANCEIMLDKEKVNPKEKVKPYKSSTDINGRFTLLKVPLGTYTLTAQKKGFEDYVDEVMVIKRGDIIYFRMPSQNQLLELVDGALTLNDVELAAQLVERAYQIDKNNIEMLFYYATVKFKQQDYVNAINFLETAKSLGSRDVYIDKFLEVLREKQHEKEAH